MPANQRGLGMVFQSYAIWPHMTVFDNVAFPLQVRKRCERPVARRRSPSASSGCSRPWSSATSADRQATKLSGGQQQRLALARALVIQPPLLLLDEPLSNLDAKLRESLRYELKRLQRELGITSIYVTHDQVEALALSTHIAVMQAGSVVQLGKPARGLREPSNKFVAEFIGTSNFIPGTVIGRDGEQHSRRDEQRPAVPRVGARSCRSAQTSSSRSAPRRSSSPPSRAGDRSNEWHGTVVTRAFLGDAVDHVVAVGKHEIRARVNPAMSIEPGTEVYLQLRPDEDLPRPGRLRCRCRRSCTTATSTSTGPGSSSARSAPAARSRRTSTTSTR